MSRFLSVLFALVLFSAFHLTAQLRSTDNQADYIIITSRQLDCPALHEFEQFRRNNGLTVRTVFVDEIYSEFSDTTQPASIRQFTHYAVTTWKKPSPRYLLLAGGVQFVPSNYLNDSLAFWTFGETHVSLDVLYAIDNSTTDYVQKIALGRLPATNVNELTTMLQKTMRYQQESRLHYQDRDLLIVSDKQNGDFFDEIAAEIAKNFPSLTAKHISFYENSPDLGSRAGVFAEVEKNPKIFLYMGHGGSTFLSASRILTADEIPLLIKNTFPFIYLAETCCQNFDDTTRRELVENFLLIRNGAVATIATSGASFALLNKLWVDSLMKTITETPNSSLGISMQHVRNTLGKGASGFDIYNRFTLLGDPYIKIPFDNLADVPGKSDVNFEMNECAPSVAGSYTRLHYYLPTSGRTNLMIVDALGRVVNVMNDVMEDAGSHVAQLDVADLPSGMYMCRLEFEGNVLTRKLIVVH